MASTPFMRRATWVQPQDNARPTRGLSRGWSTRRDIMAMQAELDDQIFNSSLGSPLSSFEGATVDLVGGKALQCWRLTRHGFPVPTSFVIPSYVYSLHIGEAGVVNLIHSIFSKDVDLKGEEVRESVKSKLEMIQKLIIETPINEEVQENLDLWLASLPDDVSCAVRSSGTSEDLASQSFAGQYDSFMYKSTVKEICDAVKLCWASMFKPFVLDYAARTSADEVYLKPPKMGVLVMKMVTAKASGVVFSRNLWGSKDEVMIEAVLGQGEGLVGGQITPDRFVVDKYSTRLCYQENHEQTKKFVKSDNCDGVEMITMAKPHAGPVLSDSNLKSITRMAESIESFYNKPQDIEWAIGEQGQLYLLQSRPITTTENNLTFLPPGDGFWTFDPTHFPKPVTPWQCSSYSLSYSDPLSLRIGCIIKSIKFRYIHGFAFEQPEFRPPSPALERAAEAFWSKKLYEDYYREFNDFFRPECQEMQEELRVVNPASLSHGSLVPYIAKCYDYSKEFWCRHHTYTMPAMVVVGDYANRMAKLMDKDSMEVLTLLEGSSPETRGILNREDPLLDNLYTSLEQDAKAMNLLRSTDEDAAWALDCLLHFPGEIGETMREVSLQYGWRLAGGYDLITPALIESPAFFLHTLLQGVEAGEEAAKKMEQKVQNRIDEWKAQIPNDKHDEFDEILDLGRRFFRLRDERGLYTDLSGVGLCRRGILEGGRRLEELGVINKADHLTCASKQEAIALLSGDLSLRSSAEKGIIDIPTASELERRYNHIMYADPSVVPRALGVPPPPPDMSGIPPNIGRTMAAIDTALLRGIWDEGDAGSKEDIKNNPDKVAGLAASSAGKITAPVCLVTKDNDLEKVKKGDIVVAYSSSASFNIVLPLCAGIITDYGGMLSHAAIVAREYGIPAVVGSQDATRKFKDGDMVTIEGPVATRA